MKNIEEKARNLAEKYVYGKHDALTDNQEIKDITKDILELIKDINFIDEYKINRVEVIDENGRAYVNWDDKNKVGISVQDNGKTLKIFINK